MEAVYRLIKWAREVQSDNPRLAEQYLHMAADAARRYNEEQYFTKATAK